MEPITIEENSMNEEDPQVLFSLWRTLESFFVSAIYVLPIIKL
jgi:hypothetical protein